MTSQQISSSVVINTWLVSKEISINIKRTCYRAMAHYFCLNLINLWRYQISCLRKPSIITISPLVPFRACPFARRRRLKFITRLVSTLYMMITVGKRVWHAIIWCIVKPSSYYSCSLPIFHCGKWISSMATFSTSRSTTS
jgi:hypothetical protein